MKYKLKGNFTTDPDQALIEILENRGVKDLENFINPSFNCELNPYDLDNIETGANMLLRHLRAHDNILIVQDCDVDGVCSAAIIWLYCKKAFPDAALEFRVHEHKQHGLSDLIDWVEEKDRWQLIVVPDAGSFDTEYHARLNELGIDCLVLDHHEMLLDENGQPIISKESNTIIINNQLSPKYSNKSLCGAGVVYKFCEVLDDILEIQEAVNYLDLVALGEIADVMDRTNTETNYLMMEGLRRINNRGFRTLIESQSFSLKEKAIYPYSGITPIDIAFYIAPIMNAIVRVGSLQDKLALFYCFIEPDKQMPSTKRGARVGDTETAASQAARVGANAKSKQNRIKDKALELIDFKIQKYDLLSNNIIFIELDPRDDIPQEMTGLIAMGVVSKYGKPCLIGRRNSRGEIAGSARSNDNFAGLPSLKVFLEQSGYFNYVAGHDQAFGHSINTNRLNDFIQYANNKLDASAFENCYLVDYVLDARIDYCDLLYNLASHPEFFGNHIDEIKLVITNISLNNILIMGANKDSMKISYNNIDYVRFKDLDFVSTITENRSSLLTVYGRANLNTYNNKTTIQLIIDDYELKKDEHRFDF